MRYFPRSARRGRIHPACDPNGMDGQQISPGIGRGRLEAISDGIMAVAITLLALGIDAPQPAEGETLLAAFDANALGAIGLFLLSFFLIARFWLIHHRAFKDLPVLVSHRFVILNFAFLAAVCLMPFATTTYSRNANDMTALVIYTVVIATATILLSAMFHVSGRRTLGRAILAPLIILLAIPLGLVVGAEWAPWIWLLLLLLRGDRLDDVPPPHSDPPA